MNFLRDTFTPVNTTIFFITLISFMVSLILFFEYILANYPEKIILDKVSVISMYAEENNTFEKALNAQLNSMDLKNAADKDKLARNINNKEAIVSKGVVPFLLGTIVIFGIYLIYLTIIKYGYGINLNFEKTDIILIILAILCFAVEISFYLIVIHNWKFITDNEVIKILVS